MPLITTNVPLYAALYFTRHVCLVTIAQLLHGIVVDLPLGCPVPSKSPGPPKASRHTWEKRTPLSPEGKRQGETVDYSLKVETNSLTCACFDYKVIKRKLNFISLPVTFTQNKPPWQRHMTTTCHVTWILQSDWFMAFRLFWMLPMLLLAVYVAAMSSTFWWMCFGSSLPRILSYNWP